MREWRDVDKDVFRSRIATTYEPAILRGVVAQWPAVQRALSSATALCDYLAALDRGGQVDVLRTPPTAKGRIFYNDTLSGFNYTHEKATITQVLERVAKYAGMQNP